MSEERLLQRGTTLVRRLRLAPGEAMPWHRDPYHRVTVVLEGDALAIEYRDGESVRFDVTPGQADWDEPTERVHRGVNVGTLPYEEIAIFFLDTADAVPQPTVDGRGTASRSNRRVRERVQVGDRSFDPPAVRLGDDNRNDEEGAT